IALELLLGPQLQAIIAHLALAALAMLTRPVGTAVDGGIRTAPDVLAHPAVELVLGALALRHVSFPSICFRCPVGSAQTRQCTTWPSAMRGHRFTGVRGQSETLAGMRRGRSEQRSWPLAEKMSIARTQGSLVGQLAGCTGLSGTRRPPAALRCMLFTFSRVSACNASHCSRVRQTRLTRVSEPVTFSVRQIFLPFVSPESPSPAAMAAPGSASASAATASLIIFPPLILAVIDIERAPIIVQRFLRMARLTVPLGLNHADIARTGTRCRIPRSLSDHFFASRRASQPCRSVGRLRAIASR